ncbi:MAG TPA: PxKF domain-containing protein [Actinomycetota bacterium]|nr:PxKF domain-containing protein [Actinomycetota bacterium]
MTRPLGLKSKVARAAGVVVALVVLAAIAANAAELTTAELSGMVNNVTVEQGQTVSFQISLTATGTIRCSATPVNPATAKVDVHYLVDAFGGVSSDTPSAPARFYADPFCNITWTGDPTPQVVTATVSADINTPLGDHLIRLHTVMTTPGGSGSTLRDDTPTFITFHVVQGSDKIPPVVSCSGPQGTLGNAGWYTTEVAYSCTSSDAQSGLANPSDASFSLLTTGDGADSTPSRVVKDKAGNTTVAGPFGPFKIDTVAPSVSCGAPAGTLGKNGWYTSAVTVACTSSDATSGLANAGDSSFTLSTSGEGSDTIGARTVPDVAGNSTSTGSYGPFNVDLHDPTITTSSPADGAVYILGSTASASYGCADTAQGSGIETCAGTTQDGGAIDTSSVGPHTFSVTATDRSGRTTTVTHAYSVVFAFGGIETPAGKIGGEAGRAIPVWFSLGGVSDLAAVQGVTSLAVSCDSGAPLSAASSIKMNGGLSYEDGRFKLVWKTDKAWSGGSRELRISLSDGTTHTATFTFR